MSKPPVCCTKHSWHIHPPGLHTQYVLKYVLQPLVQQTYCRFFLPALQTQLRQLKYFANGGAVTRLCLSTDCFFIFCFDALLMLSSIAFSFSSISFSVSASTSMFLKLKTVGSSYSSESLLCAQKIVIDTENIDFCNGQHECKNTVRPPRYLPSSLKGGKLLPQMVSDPKVDIYLETYFASFKQMSLKSTLLYDLMIKSNVPTGDQAQFGTLFYPWYNKWNDIHSQMDMISFEHTSIQDKYI